MDNSAFSKRGIGVVHNLTPVTKRTGKHGSSAQEVYRPGQDCRVPPKSRVTLDYTVVTWRPICKERHAYSLRLKVLFDTQKSSTENDTQAEDGPCDAVFDMNLNRDSEWSSLHLAGICVAFYICIPNAVVSMAKWSYHSGRYGVLDICSAET